MDARKTPLGRTEALALLRDVDAVYATRGRSVVHVDLQQSRPDEAALLRLLLGPTGNLRAPTVRAGRTLIVGFDETTYGRLIR